MSLRTYWQADLSIDELVKPRHRLGATRVPRSDMLPLFKNVFWPSRNGRRQFYWCWEMCPGAPSAKWLTPVAERLRDFFDAVHFPEHSFFYLLFLSRVQTRA